MFTDMYDGPYCKAYDEAVERFALYGLVQFRIKWGSYPPPSNRSLRWVP